MIKVGIVGGTGYTGVELLRLLAQHPQVELRSITSRSEAGISVETIKQYAGKIPILGVCLGHQAIGEAFGGKIIRAQKVMHGKTDNIHHTGVGVFKNLPDPFKVTVFPVQTD